HPRHQGDQMMPSHSRFPASRDQYGDDDRGDADDCGERDDRALFRSRAHQPSLTGCSPAQGTAASCLAGTASRPARTAWPPATLDLAPLALWLPTTLKFAPPATWLPIASSCAPDTVTAPALSSLLTATFVPPSAARWTV